MPQPNPEERARIVADGLKHAESTLSKTISPHTRLLQKAADLSGSVRTTFLSRIKLLGRPMHEQEALEAIHVLYRDSFASWSKEDLSEYLSTFLAKQALDYMKEASL